MLKTIYQNLSLFSPNNAFCIGGRFYTYSDLRSCVSGILDSFKEKAKNDEIIGILTQDSMEVYATILAAIFSNKTFVPINPENPEKRIKQIVEQAGLTKIYGFKHSEKVKTLVGEDNFVITNGIKSSSKIVFTERSKNNYAYILFTSGSTGIPKGVPISYFALDSFLAALFKITTDVDENDKFLQMFDLTFDLSIMSYLAPLCKGSCAYTLPEGEIKYMYIYELLEEQEITIALMVPSILSYLKPYFDDIRLEKMKYSLFCGEAFHEDICKEWIQCIPNAKTYNVYGPTEATIFCTEYLCGEENKTYNGILCIGKPMENMGCLIVDGKDNELPQGEQGELLLYGSQLTPGYLNNNEKNEQSFFTKNNVFYYRSGDLCFVDKDGYFLYCGRIDHQVKIDGYRVELNEIEHHVRDAFEVQNAVCVAFINQIGNTQLHLFLEKFEGDSSAVKTHLKTKLPDYMIPAETTILKEFPLNVNGKIDRKELTKTLEKQ
jgi:amino acid adenylation domain-containing protein